MGTTYKLNSEQPTRSGYKRNLANLRAKCGKQFLAELNEWC
jgi:hypothetical protein